LKEANYKPVIIIGGGGHAKVLADCLILNQIEIIGFTDPDFSSCDNLVTYDIEYLGSDEKILKFKPEEVSLVNGLGGVEKLTPREEIFTAFQQKGYGFALIIHPSVIIANDVLLEEGVQIMAGAVIQPGVVIGANSIINTNASIDHDSWIGRNAHIAPGTVLSGSVKVSDNTFIGAGSTVMQGIQIGKNVMIGAASLVNSNIQDYAKAYGVPAKVVKT